MGGIRVVMSPFGESENVERRRGEVL